MNPAALSALAALTGSAIGALASLASTWLTHHHQDRVQQRAQEYSRRERLFGDFIVEASKLLGDSLTHQKVDPATLVPLYAVKPQLGLFASKETLEQADEVLCQIVNYYFQPTADWYEKDYDVLCGFTEAARRELGSYQPSGRRVG